MHWNMQVILPELATQAKPPSYARFFQFEYINNYMNML